MVSDFGKATLATPQSCLIRQLCLVGQGTGDGPQISTKDAQNKKFYLELISFKIASKHVSTKAFNLLKNVSINSEQYQSTE